MTIQPKSQTLAEYPLERRRSKRVPMTFHIEVSGIDSKGRLFRDRTVTNDVSEGGCQFELTREIEARAPISIQVVSSGGTPHHGSKPHLFEVARVEITKFGCMVGAMQLQPANIWHMTFPLIRARR